MASEEQCLSEPLNNVTDAVESKDTRQAFSDDFGGLEEFLSSSSEQAKLPKYFSDDTSFGVSDVAASEYSSSNTVLQKDGDEGYDGLCKDVTCISVTSATQSFGGWCGNVLQCVQNLPVEEKEENASVIPYDSSGDILQFPHLECLSIISEDQLPSSSLTKHPEFPIKNAESSTKYPTSPGDSESSPGDPDSPTGDPDSPTGDPDSPTGDPDSPTGDPEPPTGNPKPPTGDPDSPTGDPDSPTGDPEPPTGDPDSRTGDPEPPNGDPEPPNGDPEPPNGDPEPLNGDLEPPTGDPEFPTGDPISPTGDLISPIGDPEFPIGDPESPIGDPESPTRDLKSLTEDLELEASVLMLKEYALSDDVILASISNELLVKKGEGMVADISTVIGQINCLDLVNLEQSKEEHLELVIDDLGLSLNSVQEPTIRNEVVDSASSSSSACMVKIEEILDLSCGRLDVFNTDEFLEYNKGNLSYCEGETIPIEGVEPILIPSLIGTSETKSVFMPNAQIQDDDFFLLKVDASNSCSDEIIVDLINLNEEDPNVAPFTLNETQGFKISCENSKELATLCSFSTDGLNAAESFDYSQVQKASDKSVAKIALEDVMKLCSDEQNLQAPCTEKQNLQALCTEEMDSKLPVADKNNLSTHQDDEHCSTSPISDGNDSVAPCNVEKEVQNAAVLSLPKTLPTITEKVDIEEASGMESFEDIEFNLQNSPMLRRSRQLSGDKTRRDCRFIFGDEGSDDSGDGTPTSQKSFIALRDSLDIAKHSHLFGNSDEVLKSESDEVKVTTNSSFESSSSDSSTAEWKPPPYELNHPTKPHAHKTKKTSIKTDRERDGSRRVSFPEDDSRLITSYLEPANPWYHMNEVSTDAISEAYKRSCERHKTRALPAVLQQIVALPVDMGGRIECLSIRNHKLEAGHCECLEEIFRRVQFHTVDLEACELDDESAIPLFDMIEFYDSALQLNISHNSKIGNRGWQACARMMKRTPSLRILEARNTNLSEQNMPIICKALRCGTRLHTLHLENCNLTGRPLVNLVGALRLNDTITDLYLADNRLGANDSIQLGNLVRSNKTLKLLDLRNNNIQDSGCAHICKDIAEQQSFRGAKDTDQSVEDSGSSQVGLSTLVLWNNHITVHAVPYFSLMLHSNVTLETLNLGRNNLTSEGVLLLKNSLMRNKCLKRLGLQATRIGNEGAVALAECIADNTTISRIDLRENSIQVAGLLALSRSLKINGTVVQLDLDANPRAEPSPELSDQHLTLHHEIKTLCQRNQTNDHLKNATEPKEEKEHTKTLLLLSPEKRKISLTCETTHKNQEEKPVETAAAVIEGKKYRSPAPSPSVSPCPSPSLSPSPSPVPSPLKNRFKVCRVAEASGTFNSSFEMSSSNAESILSTSAPAFLMHSMSGSLPSLVSSTRPNRFTGGGRFTVTKVQESSSFKSSLPCNRAMSSPSLIALSEKNEDVAAPTIVVSSPNKAVRGFSVTTSEEDISYSANHELKRNSSLDLPVTGPQQRTSSSSSDSNSPQDDVFIEGNPHSMNLGSSSIGRLVSQTLTNTIASTDGRSQVLSSTPSPLSTPAHTSTPIHTSTPTHLIAAEFQRAPLASIEAGSFDSDSEDSEVTTQSSDSTHSDEVRIATEQSNPIIAWEEKGSDSESAKCIKDIFVNQH